MTPDELAAELGITGRTLRAWLRDTFPRSDTERHQRWILDDRMILRARERFS